MLPGWYQLVSRRSRKELALARKSTQAFAFAGYLLDENDTPDRVRTSPTKFGITIMGLHARWICSCDKNRSRSSRVLVA
jgi:hypothetical protein